MFVLLTRCCKCVRVPTIQTIRQLKIALCKKWCFHNFPVGLHKYLYQNNPQTSLLMSDKITVLIMNLFWPSFGCTLLLCSYIISMGKALKSQTLQENGFFVTNSSVSTVVAQFICWVFSSASLNPCWLSENTHGFQSCHIFLFHLLWVSLHKEHVSYFYPMLHKIQTKIDKCKRHKTCIRHLSVLRASRGFLVILE